MSNIPVLIAFIAGLLSLLSPCILPLIPSYILFLTGVTVKEYQVDINSARRKTLINALFFVLGFSLVFIALGATASAIGQVLMAYRSALRIAGGLMVIFLGLFLLRVINLSLLQTQFGLDLRLKPDGYLGAFIFGMGFSAAWVPCAGPILGSILVLASVSSSLNNGIILLVFYSMGVAVPFVLAAWLLDLAIVYIKKVQQLLGWIETVSGVLLILIGLMILTNSQQVVSTWLGR